MAMIPLAEYARRLEKGEDSARRIARTGGFKTAVKIGNTWLIDEDEPWVDRRVRTGKYSAYWKRRREEYAAWKEKQKKLEEQTQQQGE